MHRTVPLELASATQLMSQRVFLRGHFRKDLKTELFTLFCALPYNIEMRTINQLKLCYTYTYIVL